jgi:hypothetical protein
MVIVCSVIGPVMSASATKPSLPAPGTAAQVRSLVAASTSIRALPSDLVPTIAAASGDNAARYYRNSSVGCSTVTQCVYGDPSSSTTVVLYGDSHAQMWLPALAPVATADDFKLVLLWHSGCPIEAFETANVTCEKDRTTDLKLINALDPAVVLLSNKVTDIVGPSGVIYTNAQWVAGLKATIVALQSKTTKVVVVGDVNQFDQAVPTCLAMHPSRVQLCAVDNPNPKYTQHFAAEATAAKDTHAGYINPMSWVCTKKKCSPIIGTMVVDSDQGHVTATYAEYLTNVWNTAIQQVLP